MSTLVELRARYGRWLFEEALPLWWERGADHVNGGFHEALTLDGRSVSANRRARVQARQVFVYAAAGRMGWHGPWRDAVRHGLDFFLGHYLRPDGQVRTLVSAKGASLDETAHLYDQAFALLALASAFPVADDPARLRTVASTMREAVIGARRLPEGGYAEVPPHVLQSNAHMHLFEAALAWEAVDDDPAWTALADEIAALCLACFIDRNGMLHEFFHHGWTPASGIEGRIVEPGHQFEWAWLLHRWAAKRGHAGALAAARRLVEVGLSGVDARGVANQQMLDDGSVHDPVARLWPQTEWIKAAMICAEAGPDEDASWHEKAARAAEGLWLYLDTSFKGVWRDKLRPDGTWVDEPTPASSFYHIVCALEVLGVAR